MFSLLYCANLQKLAETAGVYTVIGINCDFVIPSPNSQAMSSKFQNSKHSVQKDIGRIEI